MTFLGAAGAAERNGSGVETYGHDDGVFQLAQAGVRRSRPRPARDVPPLPPYLQPATAEAIRREAIAAGVDPDYATAVIGIENPNFDVNERSSVKGSSARGPFQFNDATWRESGGGDRADVGQNFRNFARRTQQIRQALTRRLGRSPDNRELYVGHQQGPNGGPALLSHPELNAISALEAAGVSHTTAASAILRNRGVADMTAGEFVQMLRNHYDDVAGLAPIAAPHTGNYPAD